MNKKILIPIVVVGILLVAGIAFLAIRLDKQLWSPLGLE